MTEELVWIGLDVGHRRVGHVMRQNGISVLQPRKHKVTTDSDHRSNIALDLLNRGLLLPSPIGNGPATSAIYGRAKDGCIWLSSLICTQGV